MKIVTLNCKVLLKQILELEKTGVPSTILQMPSNKNNKTKLLLVFFLKGVGLNMRL